MEQNKRKQSFPVEIYTDSTQPILQINVLTPLGRIFASYLWKDQKHQVILPSRKQYFKQVKWPSDFPLQGLIQDPSWLHQALLQKWSKDWNCEKTSKNSQLKKCKRNDVVIEWKKKFFQKEQVYINLKKEGFHSKLTSHESPSHISLNTEIPEGFQRIYKVDLSP